MKIEDNWILCSDELPAQDDVYLVIWRTAGFPYLYYEIQEFCDGKWCIDIPQAISDHILIIAWQELPEIPEELKR